MDLDTTNKLGTHRSESVPTGRRGEEPRWAMGPHSTAGAVRFSGSYTRRHRAWVIRLMEQTQANRNGRHRRTTSGQLRPGATMDTPPQSNDFRPAACGETYERSVLR